MASSKEYDEFRILLREIIHEAMALHAGLESENFKKPWAKTLKDIEAQFSKIVKDGKV